MNPTALPKVIHTAWAPPEALAPLEGIAEVVQPLEGALLMPREEVLRLAPDAEGIINQAELEVDAELLDAAPRLRIVANVSMGVDNLDPELMARRGVWATNCRAAYAEAVADHAMCLMLALARRLLAADAYVRSGRWPRDGFQPGRWDGMLLGGKVLGVIGFGNIGRAVARRARAFGMRVIVHDHKFMDHPDFRLLDELMAEADVVSLHVPLKESSHQLIDAERLKRIKPGALLLNLSRGPVVDQTALIDALESGRLGGAGLDVFETEPEIPEALRQSPNVVLTPHIGGGTVDSRLSARRLSAENVALVLQGRTPWTPVNDPTLYNTLPDGGPKERSASDEDHRA